MKKTYNVYSKNLLNFSVVFFFTLFFLGMSSSVSAQQAPSTAFAGSSVDADYSIVLKAEIGVTTERAVEILEKEFNDVREESRTNLTPVQEAENGARWVFLEKTMMHIGSGLDLKSALQMGQGELTLQVARYTQQVQSVVSADAIAREYVALLK
jgi:hypothetical protein